MSPRSLFGIGVLAVVVVLSGCQLVPGVTGPDGESVGDTTTPAAEWNSSAVAVVDESMRRTGEETDEESVALRCTVEPQTSTAQDLVVRARFHAGNGSVLATVYSNGYTVDADGSITVTLTFPHRGDAAGTVASGGCTVGTM